LKCCRRWFIHHRDAFGEDVSSEVRARCLGWERMQYWQGSERARCPESTDTSKIKGLLSSDKVLFVGVKW
jgi:hypothetical protein